MRFTVSPLAERDMESIGDYIAGDNPARAVTFVQALRAQFTAIANAPQACRLRPELGAGIRACACGNYTIFYKAVKASVTIVRVLHGAMDVSAAITGSRA